MRRKKNRKAIEEKLKAIEKFEELCNKVIKDYNELKKEIPDLDIRYFIKNYELYKLKIKIDKINGNE